MRRATEPDLPDDERLYRRLREAWLDGDRVLDDAIDLEGTSCDRARFRQPAELISEDWPEAAWIVGSNLPRDLKPPSKETTWEFFAVDDPREENPAHCEIRIRRGTKKPSRENDRAIKKQTPAVRSWLKNVVAARFRVLSSEETT